MVKVLPDTYTMLLMSLLISADKPVVLLVLSEWLVLLERLVLLRRGVGFAFGLATGFWRGFGLVLVTAGFGLLRVMVVCAVMPMGQSMMSRVRIRCLGLMMYGV